MSKLRGSFGTYKTENGQNVCSLEEVARELLDWGDIPHKINDTRAQELSLLAQDYIKLLLAQE